MDRTNVDGVADRTDRFARRWVPHLLRWSAGLLWLSNAGWKVPPDFGRSGDECRSLCRYLEEGINHPVLPGSSWLFEHVLVPNLTVFGWSTVLIETTLAALFISGRHLRTAAVLGMVQSAGIGLAVANADGEWYWSYALMIVLHLAVLATAVQVNRPSLRVNGLVLAGYGVVVALAHREAPLAGDENALWSLFDQRNDFPGDFGRNVFPGSVLLGVVLVGLGLLLAFAAPKLPVAQARAAGWVLLVLTLLALVVVAAPRIEGWWGIRPSNIAMVLVAAFTLISPSASSRGRLDDVTG
jgi:thiosulfate dehydrogenase [quinone] large subunit